MMKKMKLAFGFCLLLLLNCKEKDNTFLITENSVGPLLKKSHIDELETIFVRDSVVKDTTEAKIGSTIKRIKIFESGGKHLLTLTPSTDSVPTVENVRFFDARYATNNGIGIHSTFEDIQKSYGIKKIVTTMNSVVIFPKKSNLYFTIDKEELPSSVQYTTANIEAVQIPGTAKIKYLMLGWE